MRAPVLRLLVLLLAFAAAPLSLAIDASEPFDDPVLEERYKRLAAELRCLVCQNQTILDSNVQLAVDLRRELRTMIEQGMSDAEILKFMTDRYGDFVRFRPPVAPRTWLLWAAPVLLLGAAVGTAAVVIVRRSRMPMEDPVDDEAGADGAGQPGTGAS
ncbi:MAG: cytochrome c-type biogenesis protein CcmH [Proteobacteria bacterium]|nr:MAG: cytochrome c-type biogenesis protein CcmH [Pseudomonadota bacterium]